MPQTITESDLEYLIRAVFLDGDTFSMLRNDGIVKGQMGNDVFFRATPMRGYETLFRVDIVTDVDDFGSPPLESFVFHRHDDKVPKDRPGPSMEVYRIESDNQPTLSNVRSPRSGLMASDSFPSMKLVLRL